MPFAWPGVQLVGDPVALFLSQTFHAGAPGQVLSEQAIEVFVASPLPRMIGRGEVALDREDALQDLITVKLGAVVEGQGTDLFPMLGDGVGSGPGGLVGGARGEFLDHGKA